MTMYRLIPEENRMALFRSQKLAAHHREVELEAWLANHLDVLTDGEPLLLIGRQVSNSISGTLDLVALDADGNVVVVELKREKPPRDSIAQVLEYATWAAGQSHEDLVAQADRHLFPQTLARRWAETFPLATIEDGNSPPAELSAGLRLNERQRVFLVVEGYSERITAVGRYLRKIGIDFNLVTFHYYCTENGEKIINFEWSVGPDQDRVVAPAGAGRGVTSSEEATVARWSPPLRTAYDIFREQLFDSKRDLLRINPTKKAVSFRMQLPDRKESVNICTFEPDRGKGSKVTVAIFKPSLSDFLDMEAIVRGIERDKPERVTISNKPTWLTLGCEPGPELMVQLAGLVDHYLLTPLAEK